MAGTKILRDYFQMLIDLTAAAGEPLDGEIIHTLTATRRLRIRGWKTSTYFECALGDSYQSRAFGCVEITRAAATNSNFRLDAATYNAINNCNIAQNEIVGGTIQNATMERYLSVEEANSLGLVLDYGESIRCIATLHKRLTGKYDVRIHNLFFYEEFT